WSESELTLPPDIAQPEWKVCLRLPFGVNSHIFCVADLFSNDPEVFGKDRMFFWETLSQQVGIAIQNAQLFQEVLGGRERLRMLSRRLVDVHEAERRFLAHELHDEIGQSLTGLKLTLEAY